MKGLSRALRFIRRFRHRRVHPEKLLPSDLSRLKDEAEQQLRDEAAVMLGVPVEVVEVRDLKS